MKNKKPVIITATTMIVLGLFLFAYILPYLFVWIAYGEPNNTVEISQLKKAHSLAFMKSQKVFVMNSSMSTLLLAQDYDTVIEYVNELEKLNAIQKSDRYFASYAYREKGDFENALKYAKDYGEDSLLARVYIKMKDFDKADKIVDKMINDNPQKPQSYLYKSEIELSRGNYKKAEFYINKTLPMMKNSIEVWRLKSEIASKLGRQADAKDYENRQKQLEFKIHTKVQE